MASISDEPELYAAVLADPNDDDRRRALAAWYAERGDPRAEFILIQLRNAATEAVGVFDGKLIMRERELLVAHSAAWRAPLSKFFVECTFHRGLIGEVTLPVDRFLAVAPALFAAAPIQHLNLTAPATQLRRLLSTSLAGLVSLSLERLGLDDDDATALAGSSQLQRLSWLSLARNRIGRGGVEALAASPYLAHLDVLDLYRNPCDPTPKPGGHDLDGRVTAIDRPVVADELITRHGPRPWLANPDNPDTWPLPRDSYRRAAQRSSGRR